MKFDKVKRAVENIPYMDARTGRVFYDFILEHKPAQCLELGFAHGVSSCYIAAALHELGGGHLTCVDLESSVQRQPNIETLLEKTGLSDIVTVCREKTSYTWFLKKKIEERSDSDNCKPVYDFCYIDGCKNWTVDGYAFFLVDKLLNSNGWVVFDDYDWSYKKKQQKSGDTATDGIEHSQMSRDEFETPQIQTVFQLVVMQHPDYSHFKVQDNTAYAQKIRSDRRTLVCETNVSLKYELVQMLKRAKQGLKR